MPKEGYEAVTIKESVFKTAEKQAEKRNRSVSNYVETLILTDAGVIKQ